MASFRRGLRFAGGYKLDTVGIGVGESEGASGAESLKTLVPEGGVAPLTGHEARWILSLAAHSTKRDKKLTFIGIFASVRRRKSCFPEPSPALQADDKRTTCRRESHE